MTHWGGGGGEVFRDRDFIKRGFKVFSMKLNFSGVVGGGDYNL